MNKKTENGGKDQKELTPDTLIHSESIYKGRVVSLSVDQVRMAGGKTVKREKITHPGAVAIVPVDKAGNIILIRQYRHAAGKILWEIPAGKLEAGEDPAECAKRELAEETGFFPEKLRKVNQFFTAPGFASEIIHLYFAYDLQPAVAQQDEDEAILVSSVAFPECLKMIADGRIEDAKSIIGLLMMKLNHADE